MSWSGVLERLGGVFSRPRATLTRLLEDGEGSLYEPLVVFATAAVIAAPSQTGRALLFLRVSPIEGLTVLLQLLSERLWPVFAGALCAALLLRLVLMIQSHPSRPSLSRLIDLGFYLMLPHAVLVVVGAVFAHLGLELWFMPHRLPKGGPITMGTRLLVAYLPSLGLLSWWALTIGRSRSETRELADD